MTNAELIEILMAMPLDANVTTLTLDNMDHPDWDTPGIRLMVDGDIAFYHPWDAYAVDDAEKHYKEMLAWEAQQAEIQRRKENDILDQAEAILRRRNLTAA